MKVTVSEMVLEQPGSTDDYYEPPLLMASPQPPPPVINIETFRRYEAIYTELLSQESDSTLNTIRIVNYVLLICQMLFIADRMLVYVTLMFGRLLNKADTGHVSYWKCLLLLGFNYCRLHLNLPILMTMYFYSQQWHQLIHHGLRLGFSSEQMQHWLYEHYAQQRYAINWYLYAIAIVPLILYWEVDVANALFQTYYSPPNKPGAVAAVAAVAATPAADGDGGADASQEQQQPKRPKDLPKKDGKKPATRNQHPAPAGKAAKSNVLSSNSSDDDVEDEATAPASDGGAGDGQEQQQPKRPKDLPKKDGKKPKPNKQPAPAGKAVKSNVLSSSDDDDVVEDEAPAVENAEEQNSATVAPENSEEQNAATVAAAPENAEGQNAATVAPENSEEQNSATVAANANKDREPKLWRQTIKGAYSRLCDHCADLFLFDLLAVLLAMAGLLVHGHLRSSPIDAINLLLSDEWLHSPISRPPDAMLQTVRLLPDPITFLLLGWASADATQLLLTVLACFSVLVWLSFKPLKQGFHFISGWLLYFYNHFILAIFG